MDKIVQFVEKPQQLIAIPVDEYEYLKNCEMRLKELESHIFQSLRNQMANLYQQNTLSDQMRTVQQINCIKP